MSKFFHFSLPLTDGTLMTTVRLTVGGITAAAGLDVDEGEDFKVCVTEALLIFKRNGFEEASVRFDFLENGLSARILGNNFTQNTPSENFEDEISYALLGALVDEVNFEKQSDGRVNAITLIKQSVQ